MIRWPGRYHPDVAPVHVCNEIVSPAPAEALWAWLVRAALWPSWYPNSSRMEFLEGDPPDLALGTLFRWRTFGVTITSRVVELEPGERIAWSAEGMGVDAYHAWLIHPAEGGTRVLTEETQYGWLARAGDLVLPRRMGKHHQIWLEALSRQAQTGFPPDAAYQLAPPPPDRS